MTPFFLSSEHCGANSSWCVPPCRRGELDSLKASEAERAEAFSKMVQCFADEAIRGIEALGPTLRRRLVHLVSKGENLKILLPFRLNATFCTIRSASWYNFWTTSLCPMTCRLLERMSSMYIASLGERTTNNCTASCWLMRRLKVRSLEHSDFGLFSLIPDRWNTRSGVDSGVSAVQAGGKTPPPAKKGEPPVSTLPRPFSPLTWALPVGNFDLLSLGWTNDEASGLPIVTPSAPSTTTTPGVICYRMNGLVLCQLIINLTNVLPPP